MVEFIASDPFLEATHFWPFEKSNGILTRDLMTNADAILMTGAKIHHTSEQENPKGQRNNYYSYNNRQQKQQQQQQQQQQRKRDGSKGIDVSADDVFEDYLDTRAEGSYAIAGDFNGK